MCGIDFTSHSYCKHLFTLILEHEGYFVNNELFFMKVTLSLHVVTDCKKKKKINIIE